MDDQGTMNDQDNDGNHELSHSGVATPDDSIKRLEQLESSVDTARQITSHPPSNGQNTVSIPCHHIRLGDILMLQDRPCQVIRISTSATTGQYRYLGVDLFTKELCEETSCISNPAPSVVVQSMLGPVFKQYRLCNVDKGQITTLTETGEIKQGLPVLDQSDLYSRLEQAFDSGRGSVRVLVLDSQDRVLVVDMKVIHESLSADSEPDKAFQNAVRENNRANVGEALRMGANINVLDDQGRTALFTAIESHNSEMVKLLLKSGMDLRVSDKRGKTVLDISVSDPAHYQTTFTLLQNGAQPNENLDIRITQLLWDTAAGRTEEVERLLEPRVNHSSSDRLGYSALHEVASFGHSETVNSS